MNVLTLKNGSEEAEPVVVATMLSVKDLLKQNPIAFFELVQFCRDPEHEFFGNTGDVLKKWGLVEPDGKVHDSIRNIVISAAQGDGLEMIISWPVEPPSEQS